MIRLFNSYIIVRLLWKSSDFVIEWWKKMNSPSINFRITTFAPPLVTWRWDTWRVSNYNHRVYDYNRNLLRASSDWEFIVFPLDKAPRRKREFPSIPHYIISNYIRKRSRYKKITKLLNQQWILNAHINRMVIIVMVQMTSLMLTIVILIMTIMMIKMIVMMMRLIITIVMMVMIAIDKESVYTNHKSYQRLTTHNLTDWPNTTEQTLIGVITCSAFDEKFLVKFSTCKHHKNRDFIQLFIQPI